VTPITRADGKSSRWHVRVDRSARAIEIAPCAYVFVHAVHAGLVLLDPTVWRAVKELIRGCYFQRGFADRGLLLSTCLCFPALVSGGGILLQAVLNRALGLHGVSDHFLRPTLSMLFLDLWIGPTVRKCLSNGYTATIAGKNAGLRVRVERGLREDFAEIYSARDRPAPRVIRELMRRYMSRDESSLQQNPKPPVRRGPSR